MRCRKCGKGYEFASHDSQQVTFYENGQPVGEPKPLADGLGLPTRNGWSCSGGGLVRAAYIRSSQRKKLFGGFFSSQSH